MTSLKHLVSYYFSFPLQVLLSTSVYLIIYKSYITLSSTCSFQSKRYMHAKCTRTYFRDRRWTYLFIYFFIFFRELDNVTTGDRLGDNNTATCTVLSVGLNLRFNDKIILHFYSFHLYMYILFFFFISSLTFILLLFLKWNIKFLKL